MEELLVRYFHFLGIIILASALVGEHLLISKKMDVKLFKKVIILDAIYGMSVIMVLASGILLWFFVGKSQEFYSSNFIFHIKITVFVVIVLLSIFPTVYFLRHLKTTEEFVTLPNYIPVFLRIELCLLFLLPLLGVLIARGVGH
jgi:putative membrane protein